MTTRLMLRGQGVATAAAPELTALRSGWLWAFVLAVGLAATLAGPLPPGDTVMVAKSALLRPFHGEFLLRWRELAAFALVAGWLLGKPLCVIGALLWLEQRSNPRGGRRKYLMAWAAQSLALSFFISVTTVLSLLDVFPEPLIRVREAGGLAALLLVSVPAFLLNLMIVDVLAYWVHRALHRFPFFWRFHRLHHSLETDVLHNLGHPVDHVMGILFIGFPAAFLIGVSQEQLYLLIAFTSVQNHLNHTRLPIHLGRFGGKLLCDNRYHYIHHSRDPAHYNKNFADRFPFIDMLFGTYVPRCEGLIATGLPDKAPPQTLGEYLTVRLPERALRWDEPQHLADRANNPSRAPWGWALLERQGSGL